MLHNELLVHLNETLVGHAGRTRWAAGVRQLWLGDPQAVVTSGCDVGGEGRLEVASVDSERMGIAWREASATCWHASTLLPQMWLICKSWLLPLLGKIYEVLVVCDDCRGLMDGLLRRCADRRVWG